MQRQGGIQQMLVGVIVGGWVGQDPACYCQVCSWKTDFAVCHGCMLCVSLDLSSASQNCASASEHFSTK